jgi:xylulokinase
MARDLVAGIDSSTQSCTVVLRRLDDGEVIAEARAPHPPTFPPCSEQDPRTWWEALRTAFAELSALLPRVAAVSVGGQGHGLVLLDKAGIPLRRAKLWNDTESAPDAASLLLKLPASEWAHRTGSIPGPALTISKLAWTARNHPGMIEAAAGICLPFDYLIHRLSGRFVTERGGSSGTGYFNPLTNKWDAELASLAAPNVDWSSKLPAIIDSSDAAGALIEGAELGPLTGIAVGAGTGDNMAAALGLAVKDGDTVISIGTSGTIYAISAAAVHDPSGLINGYADATGRYLPMVTTLNAAKVTDTFRRLLGVTPDQFDTLALSAPAGAEGVTLVPYLDGERTPNLPNAAGQLFGLRNTTTPATLARASVEGVLCGLLEGGDCLKQHDVSDRGRLILTGGASRSRAYCQILADLTGRAVWTSPIVEAAAAGAAIQAAAALTGVRAAGLAEKWAAPLRCVARPIEEAAESASGVRAAYRAATATIREADCDHVRR